MAILKTGNAELEITPPSINSDGFTIYEVYYSIYLRFYGKNICRDKEISIQNQQPSHRLSLVFHKGLLENKIDDWTPLDDMDSPEDIIIRLKLLHKSKTNEEDDKFELIIIDNDTIDNDDGIALVFRPTRKQLSEFTKTLCEEAKIAYGNLFNSYSYP